LFDAPEAAIPIIVSGFGAEAAKLAGRIGDGFWGNAPDASLLDAFESSGGEGNRYAQLNLCWAADADDARKTAYRIWPNAGIPGQLSQDLPTWSHFEEAAEIVTEELTTKSTPCGPDIVADLVDSVRKYVDAGYDHLYFHQVGPDQDGFFRFWERELQPAVGSVVSTAA
jgi:G6PDH family F420-dependent oxidoreductase